MEFVKNLISRQADLRDADDAEKAASEPVTADERQELLEKAARLRERHGQ